MKYDLILACKPKSMTLEHGALVAQCMAAHNMHVLFIRLDERDLDVACEHVSPRQDSEEEAASTLCTGWSITTISR